MRAFPLAGGGKVPFSPSKPPPHTYGRTDGRKSRSNAFPVSLLLPHFSSVPVHGPPPPPLPRRRRRRVSVDRPASLPPSLLAGTIFGPPRFLRLPKDFSRPPSFSPFMPSPSLYAPPPPIKSRADRPIPVLLLLLLCVSALALALAAAEDGGGPPPSLARRSVAHSPR